MGEGEEGGELVEVGITWGLEVTVGDDGLVLCGLA